jgi:hypothetical protein
MRTAGRDEMQLDPAAVALAKPVPAWRGEHTESIVHKQMERPLARIRVHLEPAQLNVAVRVLVVTDFWRGNWS